MECGARMRRVFAAPDAPAQSCADCSNSRTPTSTTSPSRADMPEAVRRDILLGVPYGPAADPDFRVAVSPDLHPERA